MGKVDRAVVARGPYGVVECAVRSDGTSPAAKLLEDLRKSGPAHGNAGTPRDQWGIDDYNAFMALIAELVEGEQVPPIPQQLNHLVDGIWELKRSKMRISFYDTDGQGSPVTGEPPKSWNWSGQSCAEFPENFGEIIRLGHVFVKKGDKTEKEDLELAKTVRKEDLSHDTRA